MLEKVVPSKLKRACLIGTSDIGQCYLNNTICLSEVVKTQSSSSSSQPEVAVLWILFVLDPTFEESLEDN